METNIPEEIKKTGEEWLEKLCEKYGQEFSWPPYPQAVVIPDFIQKFWNYNNNLKTLKQKGRIFLSIGDKFNAVVLPKKRKKGQKYSERRHRITQFLYTKNIHGYLTYKSSSLEKGQIIKDLVYRFEITSMDFKNKVIYCTPLSHTFNKNNFLDNLINCNYKETTKPSEKNHRQHYRNNKRHRIYPVITEISHKRPADYYNKKRN